MLPPIQSSEEKVYTSQSCIGNLQRLKHQRYFDVDLIEAGINVVQEVDFSRMCK